MKEYNNNHNKTCFIVDYLPMLNLWLIKLSKYDHLRKKNIYIQFFVCYIKNKINKTTRH